MESVITTEKGMFHVQGGCFYNALLWCKLSCNNVGIGQPKQERNFV